MEAKVPSANCVCVTWLASNKAIVTIDGGDELTLDCIVGRLLTILILDRGIDEGRLVDWKPTVEIRRLLEKRMGRSVTLRSIKQNVLRLRDALAEAGYDRWLVQWQRDRGYRFALVRRTKSGC